MGHRIGLILGFLVSTTNWAQDVPLYFSETSRLDRIFALTGTNSKTSASALELLQLVALGRLSSLSPATELQVGLAPGELRHPRFSQPSVRVYALRKIGECGLPEALDFLEGLTQVDFAQDDTQMLWPNARVSLRNALWSRIPDPAAKAEFLIRTLKEEGDGRTLVSFWAANLLCDQGISTALPLIKRSFRNSWSGQRGEDASLFCETRIQVVSRDPDRIRAIATVLKTDGTSSDELLQWAVFQLDSLHSPIADAELDRFGIEVDRIREESPRGNRFSLISEYLRRTRARRVK